jgi:hypothetical protein
MCLEMFSSSLFLIYQGDKHEQVRRIFLISFFALISPAFAEDVSVMKDSAGNYSYQQKEVTKEHTGVRMQAGLDLTSSQLEHFMKGDKSPLQISSTSRPVYWAGFATLRYVSVSEEQLILRDGLIQKEKVKVEVFKDKTNPFYGVMVFSAMSLLLSLWLIKLGKSFAAAAFAAFAFAAAAFAAAFAFAAFAFAVAAVAVEENLKVARKAVYISLGLNAASCLLMYFLI